MITQEIVNEHSLSILLCVSVFYASVESSYKISTPKKSLFINSYYN